MSPSSSPDSPAEPSADNPSGALRGKPQTLILLALATLLAMGLWFSGSAVVPQLTAEWNLTGGEQSWMTMSVQIGFVVGALVSASLNLADRMPAHTVFAASALLGASFLVLVDTLCRSASHAEIPLSVITALIGAPIFMLMLRRAGAMGWSRA